jgi:hypothetical protein
MSSRKWLKDFNPVSKKSGEGHIDPNLPVASVSYQVTFYQTAGKMEDRGKKEQALRYFERSRFRFLARTMVVGGFIVSLSDCGTGCLYHEQGKVMVPKADTTVPPERFVAIVRDALGPMGFTESLPPKLSPKPDWLWDYEFRSPKSGKFFEPPAVDILLTYSDLSIVLSDWSRASKASNLDREITMAIQSAFRSELGAEINFVHPKPPMVCLGP